jgi:hypothetical protein
MNLYSYKDIEYKILNDSNDLNSLNNCYGGKITSLKRYNIINLFNIFINLNMNKSISVIEIGVAHGDTAKLLYENFNNKNTNFLFFDTFNGLPAPSENDLVDNSVIGNFGFSIDIVKKNVGLSENIFYIEGLVEDTLNNNLPNNIVCVHIDCDLYSPTYYSLKTILPKMLKPSIIIIDDYKCDTWVGVRKACDKIEEEFNVKFNLLCNNSNLTQAILVIT